MKFTVNKPTVVDVKFLEIEAAVRYDEDDIPNDFPGRKGDMWKVRVNVETGQLHHDSMRPWPEDAELVLCMKVVDCGNYRLLDFDGNVIASIKGEYVPCNAGIGGGDYIEISIGPGGVIEDYAFEGIDDFIDGDGFARMDA